MLDLQEEYYSEPEIFKRSFSEENQTNPRASPAPRPGHPPDFATPAPEGGDRI
jgi:hypothetical protein